MAKTEGSWTGVLRGYSIIIFWNGPPFLRGGLQVMRMYLIQTTFSNLTILPSFLDVCFLYSEVDVGLAVCKVKEGGREYAHPEDGVSNVPFQSNHVSHHP
jgi:hypothetical protein